MATERHRRRRPSPPHPPESASGAHSFRIRPAVVPPPVPLFFDSSGCEPLRRPHPTAPGPLGGGGLDASLRHSSGVSSRGMSERRRVNRASLAAVASLGVMVGHWLAYLLALPAPGVRSHVLAASGHGYWPAAAKLGVLLGVCGIGAAVAAALSDRLRHREAPPGSSVVGLATPLACLQVSAFVAMEAVERLAAGAPVAGMFQHHVFVFGVVLQVFVAGAASLLLWWLGRTAARAALPRGAGTLTRPGPIGTLPT